MYVCITDFAAKGTEKIEGMSVVGGFELQSFRCKQGLLSTLCL